MSFISVPVLLFSSLRAVELRSNLLRARALRAPHRRVLP